MMLKQSRSNPNRLTLRKFLSLLLAVAMVISLFPTAAYAALSDVQGHWAQTAIQKWSDMGVIQGSDGAFRPNDPITRGEMAVMVDRVMKYQTKSENCFSDLGQAFYTDAILKANAAGIIKGDGVTVRPADNITREEAAVMLGRALGVKERTDRNAGFADAAEISSWAAGYISAMADAGYVQGADGQFKPKNNITRAEAVALLNNAVRALFAEAKEYTGDVAGTAIVNTPDVVLKDMEIKGDLILAEGVGAGNATLDNVRVLGKTIVRGGGADSIYVKGDSHLSQITIEKTDAGAIRLVASDGARIEAVFVDDGTDDIILTGSFASVAIAAGVTVKAVGAEIGQMDIAASDAVLDVDQDSFISRLNVEESAADTSIAVFGRVETLTANGKISVNNQGTINKAQINANGVALKGNAPATLDVAAAVTDRPSIGNSPASGRSSSGGGGSSSRVFAGGNGTVSSPYQVATAAQLNGMRNYLDKNFILTADIDLSGYANWEPIGYFDMNASDESGYYANGFSGTFNGNGHIISNVTTDRPEGCGVGLFGLVTSDGKIKDLTVEHATANGGMTVAGIIGYNCGTAEKLTLTGGSSTITGLNCVGGVIGGNEGGTITGCSETGATVQITGSNDFAEDGPFVQCDIAECGGMIVGGSFGGTISGCTANGGTVDASDEVTQPVGLGGVGGCLVMMQTIENCTAKDVTITAGTGAHAVGGLCGYAGMVDAEAPATISGCTVDGVIMDVPNATHAGGMVGTGLYYMGVETVFEVANDCSIRAAITGARNDDQYTPGAVAGRATNCTIGSGITCDVTLDGSSLTETIGRTERMYESSDKPEGFEDFSAWANRGSEGFESLVDYVNDPALSDVWDIAASAEMAQMMAGMFGAEVTDGASLKNMFANMASAPANDGTQICRIRFGYDYKTVDFCDKDGNVIESHPYTFVAVNDNLGMLAGEDVYVFKADDDAGVLNYMAMLRPGFDEGMDEAAMPAHFHFYYAATKDTLGTYKPDSVTLNGWMPTMLQKGDEFSAADKTALLKCLFGIEEGGVPPSTTGILVVAHGSSEDKWNQAVRDAVAGIDCPDPVALGFLESIAGEDIGTAVANLEARGVEHIIAVPIFVASASGHIEEIKYMLGIPSSITEEEAIEEGLEVVPHNAEIEMTPALDDHQLVAEILEDRIATVSRQADQEIVVLAAHGTSAAADLAVWKNNLASLGQQLKQNYAFLDVDYGFAAIGEPKLKAVVEAQQANNPGASIIVVPVMLSEGTFTGTKIPNALAGLTYVYPAEGQRSLLPHDNISQLIVARADDAIRVFAGGSGTVSDPYQIATPKQLDQVRHYLNENFVLTADIDLSSYENWQPIGAFQPLSDAPEDEETPNPELAFTGTFDGNEKTISNLTIDQPEGMAVGLFGCVVGTEANPSFIRDLTVANVDVTGYFMVGGVVGL